MVFSGGEFKSAFWWLPVVACFHDCIASLHWVRGWAAQPDQAGQAAEPDLLLVERLSPRLYKFQRGEVVLLRSPDDPRALLVRRLIGVEGDWVAIPGESRVEKIPKGRCWVEDDLDGRSDDSRTKFGAVPLALVQGRVIRVCWPLARWGPVSSRLPRGRVIAMGSFAALPAAEEDPW